jgi:ribosome-associated heat shock protein Hsp15
MSRPMDEESHRIRLDKWLWAARLFKTRSLAAEQIGKGHVLVNEQAAKASREVRIGDTIALSQGQMPIELVVKGLSQNRGPAPVAQALYEQTPQSLARRAELAEQRRSGVEPGQTLEQGRPTKRDRRKLAQWNRWSATDDGPN